MCGYTALVRCVLALRCGSAGVVCDKIRNNFNGQAWGHFGVEERYIQDLVGKSKEEQIIGKFTVVLDDQVMDFGKFCWKCVT